MNMDIIPSHPDHLHTRKPPSTVVLLLQKLPLSVIDIAEQSPSITGDGAPVLGERHSSILFLHRRTGQLLSSFHTSRAHTDAAEPSLSPEQLQHMRASDVLAVGRVSYAVEARHALSRETIWNVTFAHWQHIPLPGTPHTAEALMNIGEGAPLPPSSIPALWLIADADTLLYSRPHMHRGQ